ASAGAAAQTHAVKLAAVPDANANESFYLAINKKALGEKYFMSAYLKQYFPGAVAYGAAGSLGTKVVTFRIQNGKLFVFDASDGHANSDTFDPELIIDAYDIAGDVVQFNQMSGAEHYILIDPAAGLNDYNVVSDWWSFPGI